MSEYESARRNKAQPIQQLKSILHTVLHTVDTTDGYGFTMVSSVRFIGNMQEAIFCYYCIEYYMQYCMHYRKFVCAVLKVCGMWR